jgi:hypothetical protein
MALPAAKQNELMASINQFGGPTRWGVQVIRAGEFHADPGVVLEQLLPLILNLLNAVMRETPVENLSNVFLTPAHLAGPQDGNGTISDSFSTAQRACVRALLGL